MKLITEASAEKLRGGFYTPATIAEFLIKWGVHEQSTSLDILEPSCGDGIFLSEISKRDIAYNSVKAIELDEIEYAKANKIVLRNKQILNCDFLEYCNNTKDKFDLIIGNPPYIRYQFFNKEQQTEAQIIFEKFKIKYSKLTNIWVPFVIGSSFLLKEKGKIAFVLPAEILQVSYAKELRNFLAHFYNDIFIVSFKKLVFPDIQQEVVLLMCEKNDSSEHTINHIELENAECLKTLKFDDLKRNKKSIDFNNNKWTFYFLDQKEIDFLESVSEKYKIPTIKDYANVEVGITTGSNSFFTVDKNTVQTYGLSKYAKPMVGRSVQVKSLIFNEKDWTENVENNSKAYLLTFPNDKPILNGAKSYIQYGESLDIHKGYKTSIRENWYVVPSLKMSDALFIRRNHLYPKLIINDVSAYTTDTMHRVFIKSGVNLKAFIGSYYNSLSLAFTEVCGRSHGGGVLELMPNEVENVLLPYNVNNQELVEKIDELIRRNIGIEDILEFTNAIILKQYYGMQDEEIRIAHSIWKKLMSRRINRN